jgi:hypothetical protein
MYRRNRHWTLVGIMAGVLTSALAIAQQPCTRGVRIEGVVTDPTGALISGAQITASDGEQTTTDAAGRFVLLCVPLASTTVTVRADGFAAATARAGKQTGGVAHVNLQLAIAKVETDVQVGADSTAVDADHGAGTRNLNTAAVQQLADDPNDFIQELQILASNEGGAPESTTIVVDGFQNPSAMPPKNSIASIRINPDPYSPEYEGPTFQGGRVEIFTKPGADKFHGAAFFTDSDGIFNATDSFSVTATPAAKRRYGFELSGPVTPKRSDFSLALEKRDIDEFNVVNATTLDQNNNPAPFHQTVAAPQRLWIASARGDLQITQKDVATLSFAANVNNLGNQGVGGLTLPDAGYSSLISEYDLRSTMFLR